MAPLLLLLLACGRGEGDRRFDGGDAEGCGSWETVGLPVLLGACTSCHAAGLVGEARHGAPEGLDLDSLAGARAWAEAVTAAVEAGSMPPGGGLSEEDAARLIAWLGCGAPGEASSLPSFEAPAGLLGAAETRVSAARDPEDDALLLYVDLAGGDLEGRVGPWSEERYQLEGARAWLQRRTSYDADGAELLVESWEPPLLVLDGEARAWTVESAASRSWPGGEEHLEQTWEATLAEAPEEDDPRLADPDADVLALALASGAGEGPGALALSWRLSETLSLVSQEVLLQDEQGGRRLESHGQLTVAWPFEDLPAFPVSEEIEWMGRLLLVEEAP